MVPVMLLIFLYILSVLERVGGISRRTFNVLRSFHLLIQVSVKAGDTEEGCYNGSGLQRECSTVRICLAQYWLVVGPEKC